VVPLEIWLPHAITLDREIQGQGYVSGPTLMKDYLHLWRKADFYSAKLNLLRFHRKVANME